MTPKHIEFINSKDDLYWNDIKDQITKTVSNILNVNSSVITYKELSYIKYKSTIATVEIVHRGSQLKEIINIPITALVNQKMEVNLSSRLSTFKIHFGLVKKDIISVLIVSPSSQGNITDILTSESTSIKNVYKPPYKNKYEYKVSFSLVTFTPSSKIVFKELTQQSFDIAFGKLFTLFNNEQESEFHKISTGPVKYFKNPDKNKCAPWQVTLYVDDDITLSMILTTFQTSRQYDTNNKEADLVITRIEKFVKDTS